MPARSFCRWPLDFCFSFSLNPVSGLRSRTETSVRSVPPLCRRYRAASVVAFYSHFPEGIPKRVLAPFPPGGDGWVAGDIDRNETVRKGAAGGRILTNQSFRCLPF